MYKIGQKISGKYQSDLADWCNENNAHLVVDGLVLNEKNEYVYDNAVWTIVKNDEPTNEIKAKNARYKRDELLNETDFLLMPDYPLPPEDKAAIVEYRTLLREVPQQAGFPDQIDWPVMPAVLKK